MQEALLQLVVVAAPAVILYFTGWSYLYFYLDAFQINISEINFDVPTVFMYSYPPLYMLWQAHPYIVAAVVAAGPLAALAMRALWLWRTHLPRWVQHNALQRLVNFVVEQCRALSATIWTLILLFVLVFILPFPIQALTKWAAQRAAAGVWEAQTVQLDGLLKTESSSPAPDLAGVASIWQLSPQPRQSAEDDQRSKLIANYWACEKLGELGLIFAAEAHYYLLCRTSLDLNTGNVFEISGKEGLVSVRQSIYRENP